MGAVELARAFALKTKGTVEDWPEIAPMILDGSLRLSADELDGLHYLWPAYYPPAHVIRAAKGGD